MSKTIVITGGHHNSALVVAKLLAQKGFHVVWFGHRYAARGDQADSAEYTEVREAGMTFYELKAGKLSNPPRLAEIVNIPLGMTRALWQLGKIRPVAVLSFGGYLGLTTALPAWVLRIPVFLHEQTLVPGRANHLTARFARQIYLTWKSSVKYFPEGKTQVVGLPLRPGILSAMPLSVPKNNRQTLLILGGKQGSHRINEVIFAALPELLKHYNVIHQTGTSTVTGDYSRALEIKNPYYFRHGYIGEDQIGRYFASTDLVISRSGAHTAYELATLGKRAILIPFMHTTGAEQYEQARLLNAAGIARILPESELSPATLLEAITQELKKPLPVPLSLPRGASTTLVASLMADLA